MQINEILKSHGIILLSEYFYIDMPVGGSKAAVFMSESLNHSTNLFKNADSFQNGWVSHWIIHLPYSFTKIHSGSKQHCLILFWICLIELFALAEQKQSNLRYCLKCKLVTINLTFIELLHKRNVSLAIVNFCEYQQTLGNSTFV